MIENKDIYFKINGSLKNDLEINEADLCSLISNMIDNAIQELRRNDSLEKKVEFIVLEKGNSVLFGVRNALFKKKSLDTEKEDGINHGLGLQIIKNIVEKYNGNIDIKQDDYFTITVQINKE